MKRYVNRICWFYGVGCVAVTLLLPAQEPIENLRVPVEYYPDGTLKTELFAERADVLADSTIAASGVTLQMFSTNAVVEATVKVVDVIFQRDQQIATSEKEVEMQHGVLRITGEGCIWNGTNGVLRILRRARVSFPSEMIKAEGVLNRAQ